MVKRYEDPEILVIWGDDNKLKLWQNTELAVLKARVDLGQLDKPSFSAISNALAEKPFDLNFWRAREAEIIHDLQAFVEERKRHLPVELQPLFHKDLTSYDVEEPAFTRMLLQSVGLVISHLSNLESVVENQALKYRYTLMMGRTHGQEAELQTLGKRFLTWLADLRLDERNLLGFSNRLEYSKISGAIGNYGSIEPELEKKALKNIGLAPYVGATQIMPREFYAPVAQSLAQIVLTLDKIATAIRLGARSGRPIYQEPFNKKQDIPKE